MKDSWLQSHILSSEAARSRTNIKTQSAVKAALQCDILIHCMHYIEHSYDILEPYLDWLWLLLYAILILYEDLQQVQ